jgi:hypothetical protein
LTVHTTRAYDKTYPLFLLVFSELQALPPQHLALFSPLLLLVVVFSELQVLPPRILTIASSLLVVFSEL